MAKHSMNDNKNILDNQIIAKKSRKCAPGCTCGRHRPRLKKTPENTSKTVNSKTSESLVNKGSKAPLGINTKCSSTCSHSQEENQLFNSNKIRRERYSLGRTARAIYAREGERKGLKHVLNFHRTAHCAYTALSDEVDIWENSDSKKCHFNGLMFCGSVWTCPNCAARIQERRRQEIAHAIDHFYNVEQGKKAVMLTFTFPHGLGDDLKKLLKSQSDALTKLRSGSVWALFKNRVGFDGLIRSLEVTYGDNGYHPHTHELWVLDKKSDVNEVKKFVLERWLNCCAKVGLIDLNDAQAVANFRAHALDVKDNAKASDYLAKQDSSSHWGADREIAKATSKKGKKSGIHPFQFLENFKESGSGVWAARWLEYSAAFKGKRQLFWSQGLKSRIGIDDLSDEEILKNSESESMQVFVMDLEQWRKVRRGNHALVLEVCESTKDMKLITDVLDALSSTDDEVDIVVSRVIDKFNKREKENDAYSNVLLNDSILESNRKADSLKYRQLLEMIRG